MVEGNRRHHLNVVTYLGKILIRGLRGIKCPKFRFFDIFSETGYYKFLIFCMMVECNRGHHLSVVPYLEKILIWGLRGIKCQKFKFLDTFSEAVLKWTKILAPKVSALDSFHCASILQVLHDGKVKELYYYLQTLCVRQNTYKNRTARLNSLFSLKIRHICP